MRSLSHDVYFEVIHSVPFHNINLQAPCVLYIGQAFRYPPENPFYIFNQ